MEPANRLFYLWEKYTGNTCTEGELSELLDIIDKDKDKETLQRAMQQHWKQATEMNDAVPVNWEEKYRLMMEEINVIEQASVTAAPVRRLWSRRNIAAAAVLIVLAGAGAWFYFNRSANTELSNSGTKQPVNNDVTAPATARAVITLANGDKVYLDSTGNGTLATQDAVTIQKLADGQVLYQSQQLTANNQRLSYNTLSNPRGSKVINMILSDGSNVWLNAGSSVTYPVAFTGSERKVSITGEAYFEVAHDKSKPFYVSSGDMEVQVLGTHFNVNAYDDEDAIRVTLLEGSVKVKLKTGGQSEVTIKPGEQAFRTTNNKPASPAGRLQTTNNIDPEQVIAWKNGLFQLNSADIPSIMRQLARWYNIEVVYEGALPTGHLSGSVPRNMNLSVVLEAMQLSGVNFTIEGKKVILKP